VNVIELLGSGSNGLLNLVGTNQLQLYLANGVTTIVNLGDFGEPQTLWAQEIEAGTRIGPRHLAGKYARGGQGSCDGGPPQVTVGNTAQDGRKYVQAAVQEGYRFIKIYNCTPPGAVDGILAEAGKLNIPVAGHFPVQYNSRALLLDPAFSLLAHANAFLFNGYLSTSSGHAPRNLAIASMVEGGTAMSTGMWIVEVLAQIWCHHQSGYDAWLSASPIELMHFTELELHDRSFSSNRFAPPGCSPGDYNGALAFSRDIIRRALDAGVEVVTGTDSPTVFGVAGFSMHSELQALRRAGLSDAEALATATGNAGRYLARVLPDDVPIGRVAPGHRADLLLLDRSPGEAMDDFPASLELVMAGGAAYPRLVRDALLERIRNEYNIQCPPYCRP
jgi:hypothetical protein